MLSMALMRFWICLLVSVTSTSVMASSWGGLNDQGGVTQKIALPKSQPKRLSALGGHEMPKTYAYGSHRLEAYDVYMPSQKTKQAPVIIMVHGGAWVIGDKAHAGVVHNKAKHFLDQDMIFISVNYPMINDAYDPWHQSVSVANAISHIQAQLSALGGDHQKMIIMGHSAGRILSL